MKTSEEIKDIASAMSKAQAVMKAAHKDSTNPAYRSKYADFTAIWDACRGPLTTNGLTVWQDVQSTEGGVSVTTRVVHASGQWVEFGPLTVPLPQTKQDAHAVGSATSYAKRYALSAAVGVVADDDDDGNAAVDQRQVAGRPTGSLPDSGPTPSAVIPVGKHAGKKWSDASVDYLNAVQDLPDAPKELKEGALREVYRRDLARTPA